MEQLQHLPRHLPTQSKPKQSNSVKFRHSKSSKDPDESVLLRRELRAEAGRYVEQLQHFSGHLPTIKPRIKPTVQIRIKPVSTVKIQNNLQHADHLPIQSNLRILNYTR